MPDNFDYGNSLISAGADLMGAAIGAGVGVATSKREWKYQKKAMELQQQYNIENWNMQNAYNSPTAQLERLEAAGINPLSQDGGFANTSGEIGSAGLPSISAPDFSSVPQGIMAMGDSLRYAYEGVKLDQEQKKIELDKDRLANETQTMIATVRNLNSKSDLTDEERATQVVLRDQISTNILKMKSDISRNQVQNQADILNAATRMFEAQVDQAYKMGMLDIEGEKNDIAREGNRIQAQAVKNDMEKFKQDIALRTKQFQQEIKNKKYEQIEKAVQHLKYESALGFITGIKRESLIETQALLNSIDGVNSDLIMSRLPYSIEESDKTGTIQDGIVWFLSNAKKLVQQISSAQ